MQYVPPKLCAQGYEQTALTEFWQFSFANAKQGHFYILTNSALLPETPSLVGAQRTYTKGNRHEHAFKQYRSSQEWLILCFLLCLTTPQNRGSLFRITSQTQTSLHPSPSSAPLHAPLQCLLICITFSFQSSLPLTSIYLPLGLSLNCGKLGIYIYIKKKKHVEIQIYVSSELPCQNVAGCHHL